MQINLGKRFCNKRNKSFPLVYISQSFIYVKQRKCTKHAAPGSVYLKVWSFIGQAEHDLQVGLKGRITREKNSRNHVRIPVLHVHFDDISHSSHQNSSQHALLRSGGCCWGAPGQVISRTSLAMSYLQVQLLAGAVTGRSSLALAVTCRSSYLLCQLLAVPVTWQ